MTTWSYSAIKGFITCPYRYHEEKVLQLHPFTGNKHTRYGHEVHEAGEFYLGPDKVELHPGYEKFRAAFDAVGAIPGERFCELKMALTDDKVPCAFDDDNRWVRGIADVVVLQDDMAYCIDWKTGNDKYPDRDQLELMSLMLFAHYPKIKQVKGALVFLTRGTMVKATYQSTAKDELWKKWEERYAQLEACFETDKWPKKTSGLCKNWCPCLSCQHNGRN